MSHQNREFRSRSLFAPVTLDAHRAIELLTGQPLMAYSLFLCLHCHKKEAKFIPRPHGDWWMLCSNCLKSWNFFQHLWSSCQSSNRAIEWLVRNDFMAHEEAVSYSRISEQQTYLMEYWALFKEGIPKVRMKGDAILPPGEWGQATDDMFHTLMEGCGFKARNRGAPLARLYRDINGLPACLSFYTVTNGLLGKWESIFLTSSRQRIYSLVGAERLSGGTVFIAEMEDLKDIDVVPEEIQPLFIPRRSQGEPPPSSADSAPWDKTVLCLTDRDPVGGLIYNLNLLENPLNLCAKIDPGGKVLSSMKMSDCVIRSPRYMDLLSMARGQGCISESRLNEVVRDASMLYGSDFTDLRRRICRISSTVSSVFPLERTSRRGKKTGVLRRGVGGTVNLKKKTELLFNFTHRVLSRNNGIVEVEIVLDGKRGVLKVPQETLENAFAFFGEVAVFARKRDMIAPRIFVNPCPKDLFIK